MRNNPARLPRKYYKNISFVLISIIVLLLFYGGYAYSIDDYKSYLFTLIILSLLTLTLGFSISKYYNLNVFPVSCQSLLDQYEAKDTRFLIINDHIDNAVRLAKELIKRSNKYIYIYTGEYNPVFYISIKPCIEEKNNIDIKIISEFPIIDVNIIPYNATVRHQCQISSYRHFIVTDYGFRYEISHLDNDKTQATFAMNLANAKNIEPDVATFHNELRNAFLERFFQCNNQI